MTRKTEVIMPEVLHFHQIIFLEQCRVFDWITMNPDRHERCRQIMAADIEDVVHYMRTLDKAYVETLINALPDDGILNLLYRMTLVDSAAVLLRMPSILCEALLQQLDPMTRKSVIVEMANIPTEFYGKA